MKHIIYLTAFTLLLMTGCSKPSSAPVPEQISGYIFFSQNVQTKAALIRDEKDLKDQTVGVVGFKYPSANEWSEFIQENPTATPNVFYEDDGVTAAYPETLTCDEYGYGTYTPLQGWSNAKNYTFFAYYPTSLPLCNADGTTPYSGGVPSVKYSLNAESLKNSTMVDVMTAVPRTDLFQGSNVELELNHRLSSLGMKINNLSEGQITITSLSWTISNVKYQEIVIPLDGDVENIIKTPGNYTSVLSSTVAYTADFAVDSKANVEHPEKLILIPQEGDNEEVEITFSMKYERTAYGLNEVEYQSNAVLKTKLVTGKKHLVHLKFTDVTVEIDESVSEEGWAATHNVENSFN